MKNLPLLDILDAIDNSNKPATKKPINNKPTNSAEKKVYSVSSLSFAIKQVLEENFSKINVKGEISSLKIASSGHIYFSIVDNDALLNVICWKSSAAKINIKLQEGMEVIIKGSITSYAARSNYQLIAENISVSGEGELLRLMQERKQRLEAQGFFDVANKKPIAKYPQTIGVITSPKGSVILDILHRINERFATHVIIYPTKVQGSGAEQEIIAGIKTLNELAEQKDMPKIDTIIIARGGGSVEDLWCFNDEELVKAVALSKVPIISAIGHETDFTLIDFAADLRAPTPTGAAELATPAKIELLQNIRHLEARIMQNINNNLNSFAKSIQQYHYLLQKPPYLIDYNSQKIDYIAEKLHSFDMIAQRQNHLKMLKIAVPNYSNLAKNLINVCHQINQNIDYAMEKHKIKLSSLTKRLNSLSHENIMRKGYAIIKDKDGNTLKNIKDISDEFSVNMQDGSIKAKKL